MRLSFTPTIQDYVYLFVTRTFLKPIIFLIMTLILMMIEIALGTIALNAPEISTRSDWTTPLALPCAGLLLATMLLIFSPKLMSHSLKRRVEESKMFTSRTTWVIEEENVTIANEYSESKYSWQAFDHAIEMIEYYGLVFSANQNNFLFMPKRIFQEKHDEEKFQKFITTKLGNIRKVKENRNTQTLITRIVGFMIILGITAYYWYSILSQVFK